MKFLILSMTFMYFTGVAQISPEKTHTYLALGDSYTIGESVPESVRYPVQLVKKFNQDKFELSPPLIIAKTGWTTDELKAAIIKANLQGQVFDMVSLLIGVNNQYRGRDVEIFRHEFSGLLEDAIRFAGNDPGKVFVVSIPDWGITPFGKRSDKKNVSENIDTYNRVKKEETLKKGVLFIDITPVSRMAVADNSLLADDGLHPSEKMYTQWVDLILAAILK